MFTISRCRPEPFRVPQDKLRRRALTTPHCRPEPFRAPRDKLRRRALNFCLFVSAETKNNHTSLLVARFSLVITRQELIRTKNPGRNTGDKICNFIQILSAIRHWKCSFHPPCRHLRTYKKEGSCSALPKSLKE